MNSKLFCQIALVSVLALGVSACSTDKKEPEKRLVLATQAQSAGAQALVFAGEVRAREQVNLSFRVPGKVAQRFVDDGERVKAGQVLARLDDQDLNLQDEASDASVQALKAELDLANAELRRYRGLVDKQLVSKSLFESKQAQARATQARYQQAIAQSKVNANQTGYAVIRAPGPGVISQRLVEAGQVVSAGQPVFAFAADGAREVAINVAEQHLPSLVIGQQVSVELWTQQGRRYDGKIREIAASADAMTRTYAVRVALDDAAAETQLGQSARVMMANGSANRLSLPMSALTDDGGKASVWVIDPKDGKIRRRDVTVVKYGAQRAEIGEGLAQNEWIVQAGVHLLREGETVQAVDADNRPVRLGMKAAANP
jgi:multidrug efflux system membrane fusion protein